MSSTPPTTSTGPRPGAPGQVPPPADALRPRLFNGATVHGMMGIRQLRHRCEIPLVIAGILIAIVLYTAWLGTLIWLVAEPEPTGVAADTRTYILEGGQLTQLLLLLPLLPLIIWVARGILYAKQRSTAIQMSPTQFPEGYRMVVEAAQSFGMRRVPDAYVVLGHGQINAFAAGHGFRRYVAVNSDLFEIGGRARDPEALRFVIGHEVGHMAAGHTSFGRTLLMSLMTQVLLLGPALSRAQEYTADNHGFSQAPQGVPGAVGLLGAGKYLGAQVNLHAVADRATRERGLWLHLGVWNASHPVLTWRAHALRDRSRHGRLMIRPPESSAWFPPVQPPGSIWSRIWPTPGQVLERLDSTTPRVHAEEQFGRYPGVEYRVPRNEIRLADPVPVPVAPGSRATGAVADPLVGAPGRGGPGGPGMPGVPSSPGGHGGPGGPGTGATAAHPGGPGGAPACPGMPAPSGAPGAPEAPGAPRAGTPVGPVGPVGPVAGYGAAESPWAPPGAPYQGDPQGSAPVVSGAAWRSPGKPDGAPTGYGVTPPSESGPGDSRSAQAAPLPPQGQPDGPSTPSRSSRSSRPGEPVAVQDPAGMVEPTETVGAQDSAAVEEPSYAEVPAEQTGVDEKGAAQPEAPGDPEDPSPEDPKGAGRTE